jgi:cytochrome c553
MNNTDRTSQPIPATAFTHQFKCGLNRGLKHIGIALSLAVGLTLGGNALAAGDAQSAEKPDLKRGQELAGQICAACHGGDGNSPLPENPKLAGQHYEYLVKQLKNFKAVDGKPAERANAIMAGFAATLTDKDIAAVAAFYSNQNMVTASSTDKELAEAGQALYRGGDAARGLPSCAGCHGPTGAGIPGQYPRLAGQHAQYLQTQLTGFRQGGRANNVPMAQIAAKLSDKEIAALADFIAGLR